MKGRFAMCLLVRSGLCAALFILQAQTAPADVKSVSTDGEATVYLMGNFNGDFDVVYRATLAPEPHNKSWSTLSILLVGRVIPGPGASIGLANGDPNGSVLSAFTDVTYPRLMDTYKSKRVKCRSGCLIELRGDAKNIDALLDGRCLAVWPRSALSLVRPYLQLNAEAHGVGDVIDAALTPVDTTASGRPLSFPRCAFTTRGVEATGTDELRFTGTNRNAPGAFVSLRTGAHDNKC